MVITSLDSWALNQSKKTEVENANDYFLDHQLYDCETLCRGHFMIYYLIYIFHQPLKHLQHKCFVLPCCVFSNEREADHLFSHFNLFKIKVVSFK